MSANHQQMPASEYLAKVEELDRLKHGDGEALRRAGKQAREALARMRQESVSTQQGISRQRQEMQKRLRDIENRIIDTLSGVAISAEKVQQRVNQLQDDIQEVGRNISEIMNSAKNNYSTAVAMYEQAKLEITAIKLNPD